MKKQKIYKGYILLLVIILTLTFTACDNQFSTPTSTNAITNDTSSNNNTEYTTPTKAPKDSLKTTGTYKGRTISMEITAKTNIEFPDDMPNIYFQNGYAVFYDHGDIGIPNDFQNNDTWNAIDTNGNRIFKKCYHMLSSFNQDGLAIAKTSQTEYKFVNTQGEELETTTQNQYFSFAETPKPLQNKQIPTIKNSKQNIISVSNSYNGLAVFLQKKDNDSSLLGIADENGNIIIPATIPVFFRTTNYILLFNEDLIAVNCDNHLSIIKISRH